jgi:7-cyano-7-deazaguanine synthase
VELDCRAPIRGALTAMWPGRLGPDHTIDLSATVAGLGATALTSDTTIAMTAEGLPNTFVPGRNLLFLTVAGALAYRRGIKHLVGGMCETDYSGYPDCRDDTLKALQATLNLGMESRLVIETPLMWLDKAATWELAHTLGGDLLVDIIRRETHSCYEGDREHRHEWGAGCGKCPACELRRRGYEAYAAGGRSRISGSGAATT